MGPGLRCSLGPSIAAFVTAFRAAMAIAAALAFACRT